MTKKEKLRWRCSGCGGSCYEWRYAELEKNLWTTVCSEKCEKKAIARHKLEKL